MRASPSHEDSHTSPELIANSFNRQFTTSKLDQAVFIEKDSSCVEGCKADVSRASGIVHQRPGHPVQSRAVGVAEHTALTLPASST